MALKYKVGDQVKIKSLDWYNKNKNKDGIVGCGNANFIPDMVIYCGDILTIYDVNEDLSYYYMKESKYAFRDEMIEGLVEEKTKPEPKFKIGDKITNGKDKLTILQIVFDKYIVEDNLGECGTVYFNTQDDWKLVEEEIDDCKKCGLVRNSTRCLSMDNCPHNKQRKFNVGDIVYSKTWQRNVIIHEILPGCFYKVGDLFCTNWFKEYEDNLRKENMKPTTEYTLPDGYIFKDENGNIINTMKIVLEKKEYPKTYEECSLINGCEDRIPLKIIGEFTRLINARNAYWKLYGEEMGLGKPWKPTNGNGEKVYSIVRCCGTIKKNPICDFSNCHILEFPTKEMRDAFYENFKKEIEICKELL